MTSILFFHLNIVLLSHGSYLCYHKEEWTQLTRLRGMALEKSLTDFA